MSGDSMCPALQDGDWWVVRWLPTSGDRSPQAPGFGVGDVVVARRPDRPELLIVKRVVEQVAGGWWLAGDNPDYSDDSRTFGPVSTEAVLGRLVRRYRRGG